MYLRKVKLYTLKKSFIIFTLFVVSTNVYAQSRTCSLRDGAGNSLSSTLSGGASASGANAFACGVNATASGASNTAIGANTQAGAGSTSNISDATAVGANAQASSENSTAFGSNAKATGLNSTAIGEGAIASNKNSVAIGAGAVTNNDNQIVLGASDTYVSITGALRARGDVRMYDTLEVLDEATFADQVQISSGLTVEGAALFNGGASVAGLSTVDVLKVMNGGADIVGGTRTDAITVTGGGIDVSGGIRGDNVTVVGKTKTETLEVSGLTKTGTLEVRGPGVVHGTLTVAKGGIDVTGNSQVNGNMAVSSRTTTRHLTVEKSAQIENDLSVGGRTTMSGGAIVSKSLTVMPDTVVDMEGNRIRDLGLPLYSSDAATKSYVDNGIREVNRRVGKAEEGVAMAMALTNPDLRGKMRWVMSGNFATWEEKKAISFTGLGIIARDTVYTGDQISLAGGVAYGTVHDTVAARIGIQWGGR